MTEPKKRGRPPNPDRVAKVYLYHKGDATRPQLWKSGPDEYRHEIYHAYLKRKAQANYRQEGWGMDFEEFFDLWRDDWHNRGRLSHQVCMSRRDAQKPWTRDNTYIRSRYDQLVEQAHGRRGTHHRKKV